MCGSGASRRVCAWDCVCERVGSPPLPPSLVIAAARASIDSTVASSALVPKVLISASAVASILQIPLRAIDCYHDKMPSFLVVSLVVSFSPLSFATPERITHELHGEVVAIADGDTLTLLDSDRVQHKVRLSGIDAPEKEQAFGTAARKALGEKIHRESVRVVWRGKDKYGRILGDVYLKDRHINREMVTEGFAWWYQKYAPHNREMERSEREARKERRGLWRDEEPEPPWEFRKRKKDSRRPSRSLIRESEA
jgi:endonuclease YncB( thermonuclease family)